MRAARESRGVSLRTIAETTKISVRALEALERNDISQLPGGLFSRAFVRAYATEVGLDPEQTIADFITRFPDDSVTQGHPRTRALVDQVERSVREQNASEIPTREIGELIMERLVSVDEVAYVRFASVYRQFKDINVFVRELEDLLNRSRHPLAEKKGEEHEENGDSRGKSGL